jgi:broad specificity phosphatase PhoE
MIVSMKLPKSISQAIEEAEKNHASYCDYPCFSRGDVVVVLLRDLLPLEDWKEFKAEFGNVSWDHLINAANFVERMLKGEENL